MLGSHLSYCFNRAEQIFHLYVKLLKHTGFTTIQDRAFSTVQVPEFQTLVGSCIEHSVMGVDVYI